MESLIFSYYTHLLPYKAFIPVLFAAIAIIISTLYYFYKTRGLPPGPIGVPILGYWPLVKNETFHLRLQRLQKKYGDVFSFNYAGALYINLGSVKALRDFHIAKADYFERISDFSLMPFVFQDGIAFVNGEPWKVLRKFTLLQLRELGMTTIKDNMSGPVYDSVKETIEYLKSKNEEPVDIIQHLTDKCNAILRQTMFSGYGITEQEVRETNDMYGEVMSFLSMKNTLLAGNLARYVIFPLSPGYQSVLELHKRLVEKMYKVINDHKVTFDEEHPRDFVDVYFKERNQRRSRGDPTAEYFTDKSLVGTLLQFFGDGVLGVASFVGTFLKHAVDHPEEQEKIYLELTDVVGRDRWPTIEDKHHLPYTNAFILEILRISDFFPMFPSQQCISETTVGGYRIPKGAITLMNTWGCNYNPDIYEEPEKFNPSRFISQDGKPRAELPVSFGVGKRACIGEGYAMAQVFLFLTTIIKNFKLSCPESLLSKSSAFEHLISGQMLISATPRS